MKEATMSKNGVKALAIILTKISKDRDRESFLEKFTTKANCQLIRGTSWAEEWTKNSAYLGQGKFLFLFSCTFLLLFLSVCLSVCLSLSLSACHSLSASIAPEH